MDILELFKSQLSGSVMERLGSAVGLDAAQAQSIGQAVLPAQVAALREKASTQAGAQQLLDLAAQLPAEGTQEPLGTPAGLEQMRQSGTALLPQLLGSGMDEQLSQVAAQTGASRSGVQAMLQMTLPLMLGVVGQQASKLGLDASSLGSLFPGTAGDLGAGLGGMAGKVGEEVTGAASSLTTGLNTTGLGTGLGGAAGIPDATVSDGVATVGAGAGLGGGVVHTNPALGGRRGLGWLWMLPLLLLVLLGGCFLLLPLP